MNRSYQSQGQFGAGHDGEEPLDMEEYIDVPCFSFEPLIETRFSYRTRPQDLDTTITKALQVLSEFNISQNVFNFSELAPKGLRRSIAGELL